MDIAADALSYTITKSSSNKTPGGTKSSPKNQKKPVNSQQKAKVKGSVNSFRAELHACD
jgi:hypothetical protein